MPKDPRDVFAAAAPFYDFNSPSLKPWHLKVTYQLYDENWWASPQVYRSTWTRPSATHTDWHTGDGKQVTQVTGERLSYFEYKLQSALFSPLPKGADFDPAKFRLEREDYGPKDAKMSCIMIVPLMHQFGSTKNIHLGLFPTYCFDPQIPVLRSSSAFGTVSTLFDRLTKIQNHFMAKEIRFYEGEREMLSATITSATTLNPTDPALTPSQTANTVTVNRAQLAAGVVVGSLIKKQQPIYPQDAKDAHASGTVVLQATIGIDGGVHELRVVSTPWPSLAASALWAVSHWEYKPYLLEGSPVEVETTINVIYTLGP